jgi:hypothetical protein
VALSGPARTWLMNLTPGSIYSWEELCAWFIANFASAYQQHGVEAHLHAVRQEPGETLRTFISRFTKVRGTIPHISDASIITTFRQGVRDEKMLEKLATHDVETVPTLFALADKCARATEGRAWHSVPQTGAARSDAVSRDNKKKKNRGYEGLQVVAPSIAAAARGRGKRNKRPWPQGSSHGLCPCIPTLATTPRNAARSSGSRSASVSGASNHLGTAPRPVIGLARRGSTMMRWLWEIENSGISHLRGTSRTSSLEIPTPEMTATAARNCMSCTTEAGNLPPTGTSSPCAVRSCR